MDVGTAAMRGDSGPLCLPGVPTHAEARTHGQRRLFIDKKPAKRAKQMQGNTSRRRCGAGPDVYVSHQNQLFFSPLSHNHR